MERPTLTFVDATSFARYLDQHQDDGQGFFLRFDKHKIISSLTPDEALNIALTYGWIDGLIKKIDAQFYLKYFSPRGKKSIWSTKNKNLAQSLITAKQMKARGLAEVERAKADGRWEAGDAAPEDYDLNTFALLVKKDDQAFYHFSKMSLSVQKTYALSYFTLKKDESRSKRLEIILEKLRNNQKPM